MVWINYRPQKCFQQVQPDPEPKWHIVDASQETLGRMAARIAVILMGKHKPIYTPHVDCGDFVIVTNAATVGVTGTKMQKKKYYYHTGYLGGLKSNNMEWMIDNKPDQVIRIAVRRMLPKNRLAKRLLRKLKIYAGAEHPHAAQQPKELSFRRKTDSQSA